MYDPARDAWNVNKKDESVTGTCGPNAEDGNDAADDSLRDDSREAAETEDRNEGRDEVQNEAQTKRHNEVRDENGHASQNDNLKRAPNSPDNQQRRKFKKASSHMSNEERKAKNREQRERMERRNNVESVREHYNQRPNTSVDERKSSPIIKLRSFNNFIKSVLIEKFVTPRAVVLDIGMGKGGDLQKWSKRGIKGLIGIDVADTSLIQAQERYESLRSKPFWVDFCVGDAFRETVENIVHPDAFPVDIVSSQFTMHYAFESEQQAKMLLSNVSRALKRGGRFIGTIPNSDVIMDNVSRLKEGEKEFGNTVYKILFTKEAPKDLRNIYGYEYTFYLEDAVGNVPEYVVPFEAFRALAQQYNLELLYKKPFLNMFDEELEKQPSLGGLCQRMHVVKDDGTYGIEGDQREASGIYLAFAFEKVL